MHPRHGSHRVDASARHEHALRCEGPVADHEHVGQLASLRQRVVEVDADARAALVARVRRGPLSLLRAWEVELAGGGAPADLVAQVRRAQRDLVTFAQGVDPLAGGRGLRDALVELVSAFPAAVELVWSATEPRPDAARALWFATSEALTNAAKHAVGAHVVVSVAGDDTSVTVVVSDDGPGGARSDGAGLRGVRDRVEAVGGAVSVRSAVPGTRIAIRVPAEPAT